MSKQSDLIKVTQGTLDVDGGTIKLDGNYPVGSNNVALGDTALDSNVSGNSNTAIGADALTANTASNNTAVGYQALYTNSGTYGTDNVAVGYQALYSNTSGRNVGVGYQALYSHTGTMFDVFGYNTAVGYQALFSESMGITSSAFGYRALYSQNGTASNTAIGSFSGQNITTGGSNTLVGDQAGSQTTTGSFNTLIGYFSGSAITTGSKNTIIGRYNGNQGGLNITTDSNHIVISDGDGNPRMWFAAGGEPRIPRLTSSTTGNSANVYVNPTTGELVRSTSSLKYKREVEDASHGLVEVMQLRPVTYKGKSANDGDTVFGGLIAEEVHDAGLTEFVQYAEDGTPDALAYGNMVSLCIKAIQEQQAIITALEARIAALEAN